MASTYAGAAAPALTTRFPASRLGATSLRASRGTSAWDRVSTSLMGAPPGDGAGGRHRSRGPAGSVSPRGRGVLRVGGLQLLDDRAVLRAVHEVVDGHVL